MPSKSSNSESPRLSVGRVAGHRGRGGELTVRTVGDAGIWQGVPRVRIDDRTFEVERSRSYRDRLVLKLKGVDDASVAAGLRGGQVTVARPDAPELPDGHHFVEELEGLLVVDRAGVEIGRVTGVIPSGDADVLRVAPAAKEETDELLIPMAPRFVLTIDPEAGRIEVDLPPELRELNRRPG